jgi:hypothetical protein
MNEIDGHSFNQPSFLRVSSKDYEWLKHNQRDYDDTDMIEPKQVTPNPEHIMSNEMQRDVQELQEYFPSFDKDIIEDSNYLLFW